MAGAADFMFTQGPQPVSWAAPLVDLSALGNLPKDYYQMQEIKRQNDLANMFKSGNVDINNPMQIMQEAAKIGGYPAVQPLLQQLLGAQAARESMTGAQSLDQWVRGGNAQPGLGGGGLPTTAPPQAQQPSVSTGPGPAATTTSGASAIRGPQAEEEPGAPARARPAETILADMPKAAPTSIDGLVERAQMGDKGEAIAANLSKALGVPRNEPLSDEQLRSAGSVIGRQKFAEGRSYTIGAPTGAASETAYEQGLRSAAQGQPGTPTGVEQPRPVRSESIRQPAPIPQAVPPAAPAAPVQPAQGGLPRPGAEGLQTGSIQGEMALADRYDAAANAMTQRAMAQEPYNPKIAADNRAIADQYRELAKAARARVQAINPVSAEEAEAFRAGRTPTEQLSEKKRIETDVPERVKQYTSINKAGAEADSSQANYDVMRSYMNHPDFIAGSGAGLRLGLTKLAATFGLANPDAATPAELFDKVRSGAVLTTMREMAAAGTGPVRVPEMNQINTMFAGRENQPESLRGLIEIESRVAQRVQQIRDLAQRYDGRLDTNFDKEVKRIQQQQLITEAERKDHRLLGAPVFASGAEARASRLPKGYPFKTPDGRILTIP